MLTTRDLVVRNGALVVDGDLDVAGPDQDAAEHGRDYLFGRYYVEFFEGGASLEASGEVIAARQSKLRELDRPPFHGTPATPVFDLWGMVRVVALWTTIIAGTIFGLAHLRLVSASPSAGPGHTTTELRLARAEAKASISELGARVLEIESRGGAVDPAAAERLTTARQLLDQASTPPAMAEVRKICDEGMTMLAIPDGTDR